MSRRLFRALLAILLAAGAGSARAQVGADGALEPASLAVELTSRDAALDVEAVASRLGVGVRSVRRYGPREFRLLELAGPLPEARERSERLLGVAALPGIRFATPVWTGEVALPEFPTRFVLVRFLTGVAPGEQRAAIASVGGLRVVRERYGEMENAWRLESLRGTGDEVLAQVAALAALPIVKWAEPDRVLGHALHDVIPNDPLFPNCWAHHNTGQAITPPGGSTFTVTADVDMDAPEAWDWSQGSPGILVVVLDNGVDLTHPDLNLGPAADFTGSSTGGGPTAANACHGTVVASCVAARIGNGLGTVGIAPQCLVASASISFPDGSALCDQGNAGLASWMVDALAWAESIGARVSNCSLGLSSDTAIEDKLKETKDNGMIHFSSAGNSFPSPIGFPASYFAVNAVGSVNWDGTKATTSQTGGGLDFSAPGVNIQVADRQGSAGFNMQSGTAGDFVFASGTSLASPHAAGVAALVLSRWPGFSPLDVWVNLVGTASEMGTPSWDASFGWGRVNAYQALVVSDEMAAGYAIVDPIAPNPPQTYGTVGAAVAGVPAGGLVFPIPTSYPEALVITKPCVLRSWGSVSTVIGP